MSFLSKKFWKGVAIGGITSVFLASLLHEGVAKNLQEKFKLNNKSSGIDLDDLSDKLMQSIDEDSSNESQDNDDPFINESTQDKTDENNDQFNEKISLVEERLKELSPDSESN